MSESDSRVQLAKDEQALKRIANAIAIYHYSVLQNQKHAESGTLAESDRRSRELDLAHRTLNKIVNAMEIKSGARFDDDEELDVLPEHVAEFIAMQTNHLNQEE